MGMNKKDFECKQVSITLPKHISDKLDQINERAEDESGFALGRSFVLCVALEEFLKNEDPYELVIERKLDKMRAKVLA